MLLALYRSQLGTCKWYTHVMYYLLGICIVNARLLYCRHCEQKKLPEKDVLSLLQFQSKLAHALLLAGKAKAVCISRKRGRPSHSSATTTSPPIPNKKARSYTTASPLPDNNIKCDCIGHFPLLCEKQHRCRHCPKGYSCVYCSKCNTYLCLVMDRNCFYDFHVKE